MSSVKWVLVAVASVLLAGSVAACVTGGFEIYRQDQRITKLEHPLRTAPTTTTSSTDYALVPYVNRQLAQINEQLQSIKGPDPNGASIVRGQFQVPAFGHQKSPPLGADFQVVVSVGDLPSGALLSSGTTLRQ